MDYQKPAEATQGMVESGVVKCGLSVRDCLIRGILSGAILAISTTLALLASIQTGVPLVGALVFPVGFVMIVLGGLELLTGNFAVVPLAVLDGRSKFRQLSSNFAWVFAGNLIGSVAYAALLYFALPQTGPTAGVAEKLVAIAQAKTVGFQALGSRGMVAVVVKAMLCNWMVTLGVVMGLASSSTFGKIAAAWLPIFIFFAHGYEHLVVNLFVIPAGMIFGAKVTIAQWVVWNLIPVTVGNFLGGFLFTGLAFYLTFKKKPAVLPEASPALAPREAAQSPARAREGVLEVR